MTNPDDESHRLMTCHFAVVGAVLAVGKNLGQTDRQTLPSLETPGLAAP